MKPETLLEARMTKLKLSYIGYIIRRQVGKDNNAGKKIKGSRKRGRSNMRQNDSIKEAAGMSL